MNVRILSIIGIAVLGLMFLNLALDLIWKAWLIFGGPHG